MTDSLRLRLTLWYAAALLFALAVFALLLYASLARQLHGHHDGELSADATRTAAVLASSVTPAAIVDAVATVSNPPPLLMIRDDTGHMLYRSAALASHESTLGAHDALVHAAAEGEPKAKFFTTHISALGTVRFICVPTTVDGQFYIQIGEPIGDVAETLRHLRTATLVLVPVVLLLTSVGGYVLAGRALAPVARISDSLEAIQAEDLSRRIDLHPREAELGRLVRSVNRLLDRLAGAFASLREFAGDASHQLQTPLTVMKGSIDVALSTERDAPAYRRTLEEISHETDTMKAILADLRALSLADAPLRSEAAVERTNLSLVTAEAVEILTALGETSGVSVVADVAADVIVRGDRARLQQVLFNLGENAIKYSSEGDIVTVSLKGGVAGAVLTVGDTGSGISQEDLPHIFDRFYRGKSARGQVSGSGLGLAIARRIVEGQGGAITVDSTATEGTSFTVRWPSVGERGRTVERAGPN